MSEEPDLQSGEPAKCSTLPIATTVSRRAVCRSATTCMVASPRIELGTISVSWRNAYSEPRPCTDFCNLNLLRQALSLKERRYQRISKSSLRDLNPRLHRDRVVS